MEHKALSCTPHPWPSHASLLSKPKDPEGPRPSLEGHFFSLPKSLKTGHWFASVHRVINAGLPAQLGSLAVKLK